MHLWIIYLFIGVGYATICGILTHRRLPMAQMWVFWLFCGALIVGWPLFAGLTALEAISRRE